jgi:hypothetical protein
LKGRFVIQNAGTTNLPPSVLSLYLSNDAMLDGADTLLRQYKVGGIRTGRSNNRNVNINLPAGTNASGKYLIALVDADDSVPDADDSNNIAAFGPLP